MCVCNEGLLFAIINYIHITLMLNYNTSIRLRARVILYYYILLLIEFLSLRNNAEKSQMFPIT